MRRGKHSRKAPRKQPGWDACPPCGAALAGPSPLSQLLKIGAVRLSTVVSSGKPEKAGVCSGIRGGEDGARPSAVPLGSARDVGNESTETNGVGPGAAQSAAGTVSPVD